MIGTAPAVFDRMAEGVFPDGRVPEVQASGATDVGKQRERNEDAFLIARLQRAMFVQQTTLSEQHATWTSGANEGWLLMVADGMGGQGSGDVASRAAIWAVADYVCNVMPWLTANEGTRQRAASIPGIRTQLTEAVTVGERLVRQEAAKPELSSRMGTTLTMGYLLWPYLYVSHVGDSRCYLLRRGQLTRLTTDHTLADRLVAQGVKGIGESSPWHHMLWNALGGDENEARPEVSRVDLFEGDRLLLCTDGLTRHVDDAGVLTLLSASWSVGETCARLVAAANDGGGADNITVVIADVGHP